MEEFKRRWHFERMKKAMENEARCKRPNEKEIEALNMFYERFYQLYDEILDEDFTEKEPEIRFYMLKEAFSLYKEISNYEPLKYYLKWMNNGGRSIFDGLIADDFFTFIRNLLMHYPGFQTWNEVYINKNLATWNKSGQIDKFFKKFGK